MPSVWRLLRNFIASHENEMDPTVRRSFQALGAFSASDAFESQYRLEAARREADAQWARMMFSASDRAGALHGGRVNAIRSR